MKNFAEALESCRELHGLSRAQLAKLIGKTPQFIAALESETYPKQPSLETLRALIKVLATWPQEPGAGSDKAAPLNWLLVLDLAMSAIGLDVFFDPPVSAAHQLKREAEDVKAEMWVLSEAPAELQHTDFARVTAENIRKGIAYKFFMPFTVTRSTWFGTLGSIGECLGADGRRIDRLVSIYCLSDCAFPRNLRIADPRSPFPDGSIGVHSGPQGHLVFYPAPSDIVGRTVGTLNELLREDAMSGGAVDSTVGNPSLGFIRRLIPSLPRTERSIAT